MMKLARILCLSPAILLVTIVAAWCEDAVTLRYKMKEGDTLIYRSTTAAEQKLKVGDKEYKTEIKSIDVSQRTFQRLDKKGNIRLQTENKLLKVEIDIEQSGKYTYDSKSQENEKGSLLGGALTPVYSRLSGASLTITHSPRGELIKVEGYKELLADVLKENPLAAQFTGGGSNEAAKLGLTEQYVNLPEKPVKPGDTWEVPFELELPKLGKIKGKRTYRYEGTDKVGETPTVKISVTTEFSFEIDLDSGGAKVTGAVSTEKSSGTIQFDAVRGRVVSIKSSYSFSGDLSTVVGDNTIAIHTEQTQTTETQLLDKLPE